MLANEVPNAKDDPDDGDMRRLEQLEASHRQRLSDLASRRALLLAWGGLLVADAALLAAVLSFPDVQVIASIGFSLGVLLLVSSAIVGWRQV